MKSIRAKRRNNSEGGVALLIAIFILLLISTVALSMIAASGTESALNGNYRSSSSAYYASVSGLEEARGRLLPSNINYFNNTVAGFIPGHCWWAKCATSRTRWAGKMS
jgi:Tfp pilus assembly protein PilX